MATVTIGYGNHRPECIAPAIALMRRHRFIFLEEPVDDRFEAMLDGTIDIDDYVAELDTEYPLFMRQSCRALQTLHADGVRIEQVEPFLDRLIQVHERFAGGDAPAAVAQDPVLGPVYLSEKAATGTLIDFYDAVVNASFEGVIQRLKAFALADALRFRLRDRLRAQVLADRIENMPACYVEAGLMHVWLRRELKRRLRPRHRIRTHYTMAPSTRRVTGRVYLMGPGDQLTLHYVFTPQAGSKTIDLLAARTLIFNKIIAKTEIAADHSDTPHLEDEWHALQMVAQLSFQDCRRLFSQIRVADTAAARRAVRKQLER